METSIPLNIQQTLKEVKASNKRSTQNSVEDMESITGVATALTSVIARIDMLKATLNQANKNARDIITKLEVHSKLFTAILDKLNQQTSHSPQTLPTNHQGYIFPLSQYPTQSPVSQEQQEAYQMEVDRKVKQKLQTSAEMAQQHQMFQQWQLEQVAIHEQRMRVAQEQEKKSARHVQRLPPTPTPLWVRGRHSGQDARGGKPSCTPTTHTTQSHSQQPITLSNAAPTPT